MPTYDYLCENCGHKFEQFQSIKAAPLKKCPACGKFKLNRLIGTGAGIIFKGSGFYATDYRSESYKSSAKSETSKTAPAESKKATSEVKDSKPESKTAGSAAKPEKKKAV
jgi:putative FmdB family regulatory protein